MRPIDADGLEREICRDQCEKDGCGSHCELIGYVENAPTIGGVAQDNNVLGKWISVKDRLPEVDKPILCCAFGRSVGEGVYRGFDGIHHVWNMYAVSGTYWLNEITHWMPLPEPPKEEEHESLERNRP